MTRSALRILIVAALAAGATLVQVAPASARPSVPCNQANLGYQEAVVDSAEVNPVLTHFMAINIAPGTTGERTETLTVMNQVTVTVGTTTEINAEASLLLAKVSVRVGHSVQVTTASTATESTSMRWTFNQPGYYALYKGTRRVTGTITHWNCVRLGSTLYTWALSRPKSYTTFDFVEVGTLRCGDSTPPGTLRELARLHLGC